MFRSGAKSRLSGRRVKKVRFANNRHPAEIGEILVRFAEKIFRTFHVSTRRTSVDFFLNNVTTSLKYRLGH